MRHCKQEEGRKTRLPQTELPKKGKKKINGLKWLSKRRRRKNLVRVGVGSGGR